MTSSECAPVKAKKSGNAGVVEKMERVLEIAMYERGKTLRPEVLLMNSVLFVKLNM